jgi:predicted nucleotidyltransferase
MFYQDVFRAFDERGIRYLVVGAVAVNLYGAPRMTSDLDIVADLERDNLSRLLETLAEGGYRPRLPVDAKDLLSRKVRDDWKKTKGLVAFTFFHPKIQYQEVDLILESPVPFEEADRAKMVVTVEAVRIPVMSVDHLIAMKRAAGRQQDLDDIETLERIKHLRQGGPEHAG